jgi:hypothetical protein
MICKKTELHTEAEGTLEVNLSVPTGSTREPTVNRRQEKSDYIRTSQGWVWIWEMWGREVVIIKLVQP